MPRGQVARPADPVPLLLAGLWGAGLGVMHLRGDMWFLNRVEATMTDIRTVLRGTEAGA